MPAVQHEPVYVDIPVLTYDHYLDLPNDGRRYQILEGELDVSPAPTTTHQKVSMFLEFALVAHVEGHDLGLVLHAPVDVLLDERNVVQPDIVFVAKERLSIVETAKIAGAPDLMVEILSPGSVRIDRDTKAAIYARHGVRWYWIVDPAARLVEEYELRGRGWELLGRFGVEEVFRPRLFPGLDIPLARVFRP